MPRLMREDRELRLTFCTNVLPGTTVEEIRANLERVVLPVREAVCPGRPFGLGLWLPARAAATLEADPARAAEFGAWLVDRQLEVFTLNGFPFGDFHGSRVKEGVFRPSWAEPDRLDYTLRLGRLLAGWLLEGETGSISTLSGGLKRIEDGEDFRRACARQLLRVAVAFDRLRQETGRELVLGLEPEPRSTLETTPEVVAFFERHLLSSEASTFLQHEGIAPGRAEEVVRRHLGLCYDACHQAVEFEAMELSLAVLQAAGIRIAKLQISSALEAPRPGDPGTRERLARFAEPRYLHQVGRGPGAIAEDLEELLATEDPAWWGAESWRIHFHVPVHREGVSGLGTTRADLLSCLDGVLGDDLTRHLEVETYTWGVLPDETREGETLVEGLVEEMRWTLAALRARGATLRP